MTAANGAAVPPTPEGIPWQHFALYPLPLDREALFVITWLILAILGFYAGFRWYAPRRWWLWLVTLVLLATTFISSEWINRFRIYDFKQENPPVTLMLPLFGCSDAASYWPGGKYADKASPQDIGDLNDVPDCFWSTTSSLVVYLVTTSAMIGLFLLLVGMVIAGVGGDAVRIERLGRIVARLKKSIGR